MVVHGRDKARTQETARQVEAKGVRAAVTLGDLAVEKEASTVCDAALDAFGHIDILINNCGRTLRYDNPDWSVLESKDWVASFEVNVLAGIRLARRFVPGMKERNWGRIVNVSSTIATHVWGILIDYGAAKAATRQDRPTCRGARSPGITVNAIIPGTILTPAIAGLEVLKKQHGWGRSENERRYEGDLSAVRATAREAARHRDVDDFLASPLADTSTLRTCASTVASRSSCDTA